MERAEAKTELDRVFVAYPSFVTYLEKQDNPQATVDAWRTMLTGCDAGDVRKVVDGILSGETELITQYESKDVLPAKIRRLANDIRTERRESERSHSHRVRPIRPGQKFPKWSKAKELVFRHGAMVKAGRMTKEEADRRCQDLIEWQHDETNKARDEVPAPEWMDQ